MNRPSDPQTALVIIVICAFICALGGIALGLWIVNP